MQLLKHPECLIEFSRRSLSVTKRALINGGRLRTDSPLFELGKKSPSHTIVHKPHPSESGCAGSGSWNRSQLPFKRFDPLSVSTRPSGIAAYDRGKRIILKRILTARLSSISSAREVAPFRRRSITAFGYHPNVPVVAAVVVQHPSQLSKRNCKIAFLHERSRPGLATDQMPWQWLDGRRTEAIASEALTENAQTHANNDRS